MKKTVSIFFVSILLLIPSFSFADETIIFGTNTDFQQPFGDGVTLFFAQTFTPKENTGTLEYTFNAQKVFGGVMTGKNFVLNILDSGLNNPAGSQTNHGTSTVSMTGILANPCTPFSIQMSNLDLRAGEQYWAVLSSDSPDASNYPIACIDNAIENGTYPYAIIDTNIPKWQTQMDIYNSINGAITLYNASSTTPSSTTNGSTTQNIYLTRSTIGLSAITFLILLCVFFYAIMKSSQDNE